MSEKELIEKDIDKYGSLEALANTDGGKVLIDSLKDDVVASIEEIMTRYKELSHTEFIALGASLEAKFNVIKSIDRSMENKELAKDYLKQILTNEKQDGQSKRNSYDYPIY